MSISPGRPRSGNRASELRNALVAASSSTQDLLSALFGEPMKSGTLAASCIAIAGLAWHSSAMAQSGAGLAGLTQVHQGRSKAVTSSDPDFNSNLDRRT